MTSLKKTGIWVDHASAHLVEFIPGPAETTDIVSKFSHEEKEKSLSKSESLSHNKEQHQQAEYYKEIIDSIKNYDEVLLFGPTDAKSELLNIIRKDHRYEKIKINVKAADKMTDNQKHAFVREYFSNSIS